MALDVALLQIIKETNLFSSLNNDQCLHVMSYCKIITLNAGEILFHQNDMADFVCVVISGRLSVNVITRMGKKKWVATIEKGETVGELGVLSGKARTLTAQAATECSLVCISQQDFLHIAKLYPDIMLHILNLLVSRSQQLITLLDDHKSVHYTVLILLEMNPDIQKEIILHFKNNANSNLGIFTNADFDKYKEDSIDHAITKMENNAHYKHIIFLLNFNDTQLIQPCLKRATKLYVVSLHHKKMSIPSFLEKILKERASFEGEESKLIKIHLPNSVDTLTYGQRNQFEEELFAEYHNIRINHDRDYQRMLRYIQGKAIGLVFSGGGSKGWAHLGIIKAIQELNIPIDMVSGTSVGAIVAACFALSETFEETLNYFTPIMATIRKPFKLMNITWPIISFFNGKTGTTALEKIFNEKNIMDLWVPFFCISANVSTSKEAIHTKGLIWEKLRASLAIPGILPPVVIDGQLHADGGLINNLPVDQTRLFLGKESKIISSSLSTMNLVTDYSFPPILMFYDLLRYKLGIHEKKYKFPLFSNFFINALLVGSAAKQIQSEIESDISIKLDTSEYNVLGSTEVQEQQLIELGYQSALLALKEKKNIF